ncbi:MAG: DUF459 domain-containing protein [Ilumatobacteraceae bacterium]
MRTRPSKRTFMIRRIVVLGVLVLVLVLLVSAVRASVGGDDAISSPDSTAVAPNSEVSSPSTSPIETPPTETTGPRIPSAADPARVLLVGDSEAQGLGPFLQSVLDVDKLTTLTVDGRNSTGLVRDDFFDWPAKLNELVPSVDPDIVVAFFGGNDGQSFQNMPTKRVDSPEWRAEYGKRVGAVMDFLGADGRTLIWIGVPNAAEADFSARLTVLNAVINEQVASHPDVIFIDSWRLFSGIDGGYAPLVIDPLSGTYIAVQAERDKFHLNTPGSKILAAAVADAIAEDLVRRGATIAADPTSTTIDINSPGTYTIVEGDTLTGIAAKTGTTIGAIVSVNGWADENEVIQVGQGIKLPAKSG